MKVEAKDILTAYTNISGGGRDMNNQGFVKAYIVIEDYFDSTQDAYEWESKVKQFILENRPNDTRDTPRS